VCGSSNCNGYVAIAAAGGCRALLLCGITTAYDAFGDDCLFLGFDTQDMSAFHERFSSLQWFGIDQ
jgi:hypothetical protein